MSKDGKRYSDIRLINRILESKIGIRTLKTTTTKKKLPKYC